jgi:hypothetical protein
MVVLELCSEVLLSCRCGVVCCRVLSVWCGVVWCGVVWLGILIGGTGQGETAEEISAVIRCVRETCRSEGRDVPILLHSADSVAEVGAWMIDDALITRMQ